MNKNESLEAEKQAFYALHKYHPSADELVKFVSGMAYIDSGKKFNYTEKPEVTKDEHGNVTSIHGNLTSGGKIVSTDTAHAQKKKGGR